MATPEAILLQRLAQSQESGQRRNRIDDFIFSPERMDRIRADQARTRAVLDSLDVEIERARARADDLIRPLFEARLKQLHEQDPEGFPLEINNPLFGDATPFEFARIWRDDMSLSPRPGSPARNLAELLAVVEEEAMAAQEDVIRQLVLERSAADIDHAGRFLRQVGGVIPQRIGELDQFIREHDPTQGAREVVREAPSALAGLLRAVGSRIAEGAGAARETLGQGLTDLEFLLREFVLDEIVGSGEADFPAGNPRAVRAERFGRGTREALVSRLFDGR